MRKRLPRSVLVLGLAGSSEAGSYFPPPGDCCQQWSPQGTQLVFETIRAAPSRSRPSGTSRPPAGPSTSFRASPWECAHRTGRTSPRSTTRAASGCSRSGRLTAATSACWRRGSARATTPSCGRRIEADRVRRRERRARGHRCRRHRADFGRAEVHGAPGVVAERAADRIRSGGRQTHPRRQAGREQQIRRRHKAGDREGQRQPGLVAPTAHGSPSGAATRGPFSPSRRSAARPSATRSGARTGAIWCGSRARASSSGRGPSVWWEST